MTLGLLSGTVAEEKDREGGTVRHAERGGTGREGRCENVRGSGDDDDDT